MNWLMFTNKSHIIASALNFLCYVVLVSKYGYKLRIRVFWDKLYSRMKIVTI